MLKITVTAKGKDYVGICCQGHAGYEEAGKDIVCSAVSVLMTNTLNSIETLTNDSFDGESGDGLLEFHFTEEVSDASKLLMRSLVLGLESVRKAYGDSYINITFREV